MKSNIMASLNFTVFIDVLRDIRVMSVHSDWHVTKLIIKAHVMAIVLNVHRYKETTVLQRTDY